MKTFGFLFLSSLTILAGCAGDAFESQCDQFTEVNDQLTCLDTAFFALESEIVDSRGDRVRDDSDLREELEYCNGLRRRMADEAWADENREEFGGRLRHCMGLWERLEDEDDWDDEDEDDDWDDEDEREDDWDDEDEDEDEDDWDDEDEDEREGDKGDLSDEDEREGDEDLRKDEREGDEDLREDRSDRGELGEIRAIRDRTRGEIERSEDSEARRDRVREGLAEGRRWVDRLLGAVRGEGSRDSRSVTDDEERLGE